MIVLDTNIVSETWRNRSDRNVVEWFDRQDQRELFVCTPVIAELAYGGSRTLLRDKSARYVKALEAMIDGPYRNNVLPFDRGSALKFGELVAMRDRAGHSMETIDAMIAAICIVHDATLATRNVRDFAGLDVRLVNPFEAQP